MSEFDDIIDPSPGPEAMFIEQERARQLHRALDKLSTRDKQIMLALYDGASEPEIAEEMGVTLSCLKGIRRRSLRKLRRWLSN